MNRFLIIFLLLIALCPTAHSQSDEGNKSDSTYSKLTSDQILLRLEEKMEKDMVAHRAYIQSYYDKIYATTAIAVTVLGALLTGLLTFFGFRYRNDVKRTVVEEYKTQSQKLIKEIIEEEFVPVIGKLKKYKKELDKTRVKRDNLEKEYKGHAAKQEVIDLNQEYKLYDLMADLGFNEPLKMRYKRNYSRITLTYLKEDGSLVEYRNEQELLGTSKKEISVASDYFEMAANAEARIIELSPGGEAEIADNRCDLKFSCDPPLKKGNAAKKLYVAAEVEDSFTDPEEYFEYTQFYLSDKEEFILKVPMEKEIEKIWVEQKLSRKKGNNYKIKDLNIKPDISVKDSLKVYLINLPVEKYASRYVIRWKFK